jgi:carbonic anhydrase
MPLPSLNPKLHEFDPALFGTLEQLRDFGAKGDRNGLLLACSDHGTAPDQISFASPDHFSILQNLGVSVPCSDETGENSLSANIEYSLSAQQTDHLIVCGHLDCTLMRNWLKQSPEAWDIDSFTDFNRKARATVEREYQDSERDTQFDLMVCEHLLFQLENLLTHECVSSRVNNQKMKLHVWVADHSARVSCFDPTDGQFHPLGQQREA